MVEESRQTVAMAQTAPPKSTRGRKALPRDADGNIIRPSAPAEGKIPPVQATSPGVSPSPENNLNIKAILVEPLKVISRMPARRHQIAELELTQEEAEACATGIDSVVTVFLPDLEKMNPKTAAIVGASLTVGSIVLGKYLIYAEVMVARMEVERQKARAQQVTMESTGGARNPSPSTPKSNPFMKPDAFSQQI